MVTLIIGLYVTQLTGSASAVGLVLGAYAAPLVLFLLLGGVLADRLPRRAVMIGSDAVRGLLHAIVALLIALDAAQVWHLVVIGLLFGSAAAFFRPAYTGLVPQCVPEELIQPAQGLSGISREASIIAGPAIGTALVIGVGAAAAYALDVVTFAVSIAFLLRVHPRERGVPGVRSTIVEELREGWTAVRERAWVWATIAAFSVTLMCGVAPYFTLGAAIADDRYGDVAVYGLVQIMTGAGMVAGSLWGSRWRPRFPLRTAMAWTLPWPLCMMAFALGAPVGVLVATVVAGGVGLGLFGVWWETALAQRIPPHLLSRVSAYDWMGSFAFLPAGYVLAGLIGDAVGAPATLLVGACLCVVALAAGLLPRETRMLPQPASDRAPFADVGTASQEAPSFR
jgi:predicted MFS family arabinose efflux permease